MRKNAARILFGIAFLAVAVLLLGSVSGWWGDINFSGWWTVFIIIPGLAMMITTGIHFWNVFLVLLGAFLLARAQGWIDHVPREYFGIAALVFVGLWLIFGSFSRRKYDDGCQNNAQGVNFATVHTVDGEDVIHHTAVFSEVHAANENKQLRGGKLTSVFGGVELDLRSAQIVDGAVFEMVSVFGGIDVLAPPNCRVIVHGVPIFGGMDNRVTSTDESLPRLLVRYSAVFGGIEIK